MAEAARAIAQGTADDEQRRRLRRADEARNHEDRRAIWMRFDGRDPAAGSHGWGVARPRHGLSPCPVAPPGRTGAGRPAPTWPAAAND